MTENSKIYVGFALNTAVQINDLEPSIVGSPSYWVDVLRRIDGHADFVTLEDHFGTASGGLDALLLANYLAPLVQNTGLIAGAVLNYNEPFHISTTIATLDYVTKGRAGLLAQRLTAQDAASATLALGQLNGFPSANAVDLAEDALESVQVIRQLWDSWEDDAIIRDAVSQRYIDGKKLHYIDFKGKRFNVLGPSIVPRPPQGQPLVATTIRNAEDIAFAVAEVDLIFIQSGHALSGDLIEKIKTATADLGRSDQVRLILDVNVHFDSDAGNAEISLNWNGSASALSSQLAIWLESGIDGFRFIPRDLSRDIDGLLEVVFPALAEQVNLNKPSASTLRERFGLPVAINQYTQVAALQAGE